MQLPGGGDRDGRDHVPQTAVDPGWKHCAARFASCPRRRSSTMSGALTRRASCSRAPRTSSLRMASTTDGRRAALSRTSPRARPAGAQHAKRRAPFRPAPLRPRSGPDDTEDVLTARATATAIPSGGSARLGERSAHAQSSTPGVVVDVKQSPPPPPRPYLPARPSLAPLQTRSPITTPTPKACPKCTSPHAAPPPHALAPLLLCLSSPLLHDILVSDQLLRWAST